ncbi:hypothetical protein [Lutispora sp.]|uniref:hypothetical protein n=1 Tax=Lutispora sp. TaxID=2828727 RepID=UPI003569AF15
MNMQFSSVREICKEGKRQILKTAYENEREATISQINYLLNLPNDIKHIFPEILDYCISENEVWYIMPLYEMTTLDSELRKTEMPLEDLKKVIKTLIEILFEKVYDANKVPFNNYVYEAHIKRIKKRIKYLISVCPRLEPLIVSKSILINGKEYININKLIDNLEISSVMEILTPKLIGFIHGDLEANHIMFEILKDKVNICLLDPRMPSEGGDYSYDLGKLWQSLDGYMHNLQAGFYDLTFDLKSENPEFIFNINTLRPYDELKCLCEYAKQCVNSKISHIDSNWMARCLFSQAAHFLSAPPFYIGRNFPPDLYLALYLRGVILLNEFFESYDIKIVV